MPQILPPMLLSHFSIESQCHTTCEKNKDDSMHVISQFIVCELSSVVNKIIGTDAI